MRAVIVLRDAPQGVVMNVLVHHSGDVDGVERSLATHLAANMEQLALRLSRRGLLSLDVQKLNKEQVDALIATGR